MASSGVQGPGGDLAPARSEHHPGPAQSRDARPPSLPRCLCSLNVVDGTLQDVKILLDTFADLGLSINKVGDVKKTSF